MKNIGILLLLAGAGSFVLNLIGYEFTLLMWIDMWGQEIGWAIRGAMIVVGGILVFLGMRAEASEGMAEEPAAPRPEETQAPAENQ